ncbi:MAG: hypothetical protein HC890_03120 [Chloroflexaceae bacterium]|nr:hypothetical protein [Chloroflexaceae bacterium]
MTPILSYVSVNGASAPSNSPATGITGLDLTRGAGVNLNTGGTFNSNNWTIGGDLAAAITNNDFIQWGFTSTLAYDLSDLDIRYDRSGTGPNSIAIQGAINGGDFTTFFIDNSISEAGEDNLDIDLSSFDGVTSATFRLFGFNATSTAGTFDIEDITVIAGTDGIIINGTPSSTVNPGVTVAIAATDANAAEAGADPGTFRISRAGDTANPLTVNYTISGSATNGTDYTPNLTGAAIISANQSFVDITITPVDDAVAEGAETVILTLVDTPDYDLGATVTATVAIADNDVQLTPIFTIQGAGFVSPLLNQTVVSQGVVTALASNGFYFQDPTGDGNLNTSDGIFVFTSSAPTVSLNQLVQVSGTVDEFFGATQIDTVTNISVLGTGTIAPVVLGLDRIPPTEIVDDAGSQVFDPSTQGRDFWESLEGTLVTLPDAIAVGLLNNFDEFYAIANQGAGATGVNGRGGITISDDPNPNNPIGADLNPERIQIDPTLISGSAPAALNVGDLVGNITGVIDFSFDDYSIRPLGPVTVTPGNLTPEITDLVGGTLETGFSTVQLVTVASYNVENLDPGDDRFDEIAAQIVNNLRLPDIIALQEVQDNDGPTNSAVTSASLTLETLIAEIAAISDVDYEFIDNPFIGDDTNGGQPGGNIRTAYLYNPARVTLVPGSVVTITDPIDQQTNPSNPFFGSRLPLVATFAANGQEITLINNHFTSRGGSDPLFGDDQPPTIGGESDREAQAQGVNSFVEGLLASDPDANVVVLGDLNGFPFENFLANTLSGEELTNLTNLLPQEERYSFNFEGNSQQLDQIFVSAEVLSELDFDALLQTEFDIVHINSEFANSASDHDALIAQIPLVLPNPIEPVELSVGQLPGRLVVIATENGVEVDRAPVGQNGPVPEVGPFTLFAVDSDDLLRPNFSDRTFFDRSVGIGVSDGDDSIQRDRKRIEGDEILGVAVTGFAANTAEIAIDRLFSNDGAQIRVTAFENGLEVDETIFNLGAAVGEEFLDFTSDFAFNELQIGAADGDTAFTFRNLTLLDAVVA